MPEVKIALSDKTDKIIQELSDSLGIKKTEYVKHIVLNSLQEIKMKKNKK